MIGPNFADDVDCSSFFDHIDDLLDFPTDDVDAGLSATDSAAFPSIWSAQSESLPGTDSVFSGNSASDLSAELSVPYEDIVQLEWLSNFVEDSFSGGSLTINNKQLASATIDKQFQTSSPVSVLESSSSCSGDKTTPHSPEAAAAGGRCGRARSKRPRPPTFQPRPAIHLISPSSSVNESESPNPFMVPKPPSDSENYAESRPLIKIPKHTNLEHKKKRKIKFSAPAAAGPPPAESNQGQAVRKCMHCEITKTPQWRAGPMGPKTLCNACGVRYKSGRLFPEYRPAASPTFVPSLHSNSHKKVIEMRTKCVFESGAMVPNSPELILNNSHLGLDYI